MVRFTPDYRTDNRAGQQQRSQQKLTRGVRPWPTLSGDKVTRLAAHAVSGEHVKECPVFPLRPALAAEENAMKVIYRRCAGLDVHEKTVYCRACGKSVESVGWFCSYCGTYVLAFRRPRVLRCDGVYVTKQETDNGIITRRYFRFYPDGFVIGIVFGSRKDDVATWWGRRSHDGMKGYYRLKGRDIEFACTADWGTTVYVGKVRKDGLRITSCNGKPCSMFYRFIYGEEGQHTSQPLPVSRVQIANECGSTLQDR